MLEASEDVRRLPDLVCSSVFASSSTTPSFVTNSTSLRVSRARPLSSKGEFLHQDMQLSLTSGRLSLSFGNVGYWAAKFLIEAGAKITGVGEWNGAITNDNGLDVEDLHRYWVLHGTFEGFNGKFLKAKEAHHILEKPCDILIPAALEKQIHYENAPRISAKLIGEAANGPTTPRGHALLVQQGSVVIPDMLLNAGGVCVSYFEWLKNLAHVRFGRLNKKWEETGKRALLDLIERNAGAPVSSDERVSSPSAQKASF